MKKYIRDIIIFICSLTALVITLVLMSKYGMYEIDYGNGTAYYDGGWPMIISNVVTLMALSIAVILSGISIISNVRNATHSEHKKRVKGMKEVILSHDSEAVIYSVPDVVADNLINVCQDFAINWVWHSGDNSKYLQLINNQYVAVFGAEDFIDYLNNHLYPEHKSVEVKRLGCYDYEIPDEYKHLPRFNF